MSRDNGLLPPSPIRIPSEPEPIRLASAKPLVEPEPILLKDDGGYKLPKSERMGGYYGGTLSESVARGNVQRRGLAGQFLKSMGGVTGLDSLVDVGDRLVERALVEAIANPAEITGFDDIKSLGDGWTWFLQNAGEQMPYFYLAAASAGQGAVIAKAVGGIAGYIARAGIAKKALQEVAKKATLKKGAAVGMAAGFGVVNTGESLQEQLDVPLLFRVESGNEVPSFWKNLAVGTGLTAVEMAGLGFITTRVMKSVGKDATGHAIKQVLRRAGFTSLKALGAEGGAEGIQEAIVMASRKLVDPTFSISEALNSPEGRERILWATMSGAAVGGAFAGAGSTVVNVHAKTINSIKNNRLKELGGNMTSSMSLLFESGQWQSKGGRPGKKGAGHGDTGAPEPRGEGQQPEEEPRVANSLFDMGVAQEWVRGKRDDFIKTADTAMSAIKGKLAQADQYAQQKAAEASYEAAYETIDVEMKALDMAIDGLTKESTVLQRSFSAIKMRLAEIADQGITDNQAAKKMAAKVDAMLAELQALKGKDKAAKVQDVMKLITDSISEGTIDPATIVKDRLQVLVNAAEKATRGGIAELRKEQKAYKNWLNKTRREIVSYRKKMPDVEPVQGDLFESEGIPASQGATTNTRTILEAIAKVKEGVKPAAFAIGATITTLPKIVKTAMGEAGVVPRQAKEGVVFTKPENVGIDPVAENFGTPVEQINPETAVVVSAISENGITIQDEVVDGSDPAAIAAAKQRADKVGDKTKTTVREPHEAITENTTALLEEKEASTQNKIKTAMDVTSQAFRSITKYLESTPDATPQNMPRDTFIYRASRRVSTTDPVTGRITWETIPGDKVTWGDFMAMADNVEYLASQFMDLKQFWADPDTFRRQRSDWEVAGVESLQDTIDAIQEGLVDPDYLLNQLNAVEQTDHQIYVLALNRTPVLASIDKDGDVVRLDGKEGIRWADSKAEVERWLTSFANVKKVLGEFINEFAPIKIAEGKWTMARLFMEKQEVLLTRQAWRAEQRGIEGAGAVDGKKAGVETPYIIPAVRKNLDKDGKVVSRSRTWLHLGTITELGHLENRGENLAATKLANAHTNFHTGLALIMGKFNYEFDFYPETQFDQKTSKITHEANPAHGEKIIYGQVSWNNSKKAQRGMKNLRRIALEQGYEAANGELVEYFRKEEIPQETDGRKKLTKKSSKKKRSAVTAGKIAWNDIADWLLGESARKTAEGIKDLDDMTLDDISWVLRAQGALMENQVKNLSPELQAREEISASNVVGATERVRSLDEINPDMSPNPHDGVPPISVPSPVVPTPAGGEVVQIDNRLINPEFDSAWKKATVAIKFVTDMLNLKQKITLFDESSGPELLAHWTNIRNEAARRESPYRTDAQKNKRMDKIQKALKKNDKTYDNINDDLTSMVEANAKSDDNFLGPDIELALRKLNFLEAKQEQLSKEYNELELSLGEPTTYGAEVQLAHNHVVAIKQALNDNINGRTIFIKGTKEILIFVSQTQGVDPVLKIKPSRGMVLMHEIGHIIQRTYFDRLSPALQKKLTADILGDDHNKREMFANYLAKMAADQALLTSKNTTKEMQGGDPYGGIFTRIVGDLKRAFNRLKILLNYPNNFRSFVDALLTHAEAQRGPKHKGHKAKLSDYSTDLAKEIFVELQSLEGNAYIVQPLESQAAVNRYKEARKKLSDKSEALARFKLERDELNAVLKRSKSVKRKERVTKELTDVEADIATMTRQVTRLARVVRKFGTDLGSNIEFADMDRVAERARDPMFKSFVDNWLRFVERFKNRPMDAVKTLVQSADGELRSFGATADRVASYFHARPASTDPSLTVLREIQQNGASFHTDLRKVLESVPGANATFRLFKRGPGRANRDRDRALRARISEALLLQKPDNQIDADILEHVQAIRTYLDSVHAWYTEMGLDLGHRENYYPLMLDSYKIEHNREGFIEILRRHDFSEEEANKQRQSITRDEDGGLTTGFQEGTTTDFGFYGPGFASTRRRADRENSKWTDALRADLVEAGFYQEDIATSLIAYTEMAVRRATWQMRFQETDFGINKLNRYNAVQVNPQSPIATLLLEIAEAKASGELNAFQYDRIIRDILPAYAGQLGLKTNSHIRKLNSFIIIYQNLRLLGLAVLSSIVDVGTLMLRTDNFNDLKPAWKLLMDKTSRAEAMEMLEAIGAMRQGLTEHVLNDQALNTFMTGRAKQINDLFFRYNMMEGWTNLMRAMALQSGREFIQRNARKARNGDAKAQRYLTELDLTLEEASNWDGHSTGNPRIKAALNRYIDESMIRPDATIRPVWMSDPGYAVFAHLKGFMYGFHETFLRRVGREATLHQNLLPLLMLGMLALPFAAIGYELRKKVTGSTNSPEGFDYLREVVERSGMLGAFQFVTDMEQADEYGKPYLLGVTGPAVEQLYDFWQRDLDSFIPRAIPFIAQSPVLRDWVTEEVL